jgi:hypothetical protein
MARREHQLWASAVHWWVVNVFLPFIMRTIKECAAKLDMDRKSYCNEFVDFDSRLVDTNDTRYKGSVGSFLCILQLFADLLLTVEYEDLMLEPCYSIA